VARREARTYLRGDTGLALNPVLTLHEVVNLGDEHQKRRGIPVFLADKIGIEFACPFVCDVLSLSVFRTNCVVNVMSNLMEEHMAEPEFSQKCDAKRNGG
jgi:hypothetical protein